MELNLQVCIGTKVFEEVELDMLRPGDGCLELTYP